MFGVLNPALEHVSAECKQRYNSTYCNLCAALSVAGAGVWNRFFLVNDVVTIDWLLAEDEFSDKHAFSCRNCLKGGAVGQKKKVTEHQARLAAISTFTCGVKINDNALDSPNLKNKSLALLYRPMMKKAEKILKKAHILEKIRALLAQDRANESQGIVTLEEACRPTEQCYELMTLEIAKTHSTLPISMQSMLGQYLGKCVYLLDAIADMDEDREKNQYNVLNNLAKGLDPRSAKQEVVAQCLEFIKPMRLEITEQLASLPNAFKYHTLRERCDSLFISTERQLLKLIKPLDEGYSLRRMLFSFSAIRVCGSNSTMSFAHLDGLMLDEDKDDTTLPIGSGKGTCETLNSKTRNSTGKAGQCSPF